MRWRWPVMLFWLLHFSKWRRKQDYQQSMTMEEDVFKGDLKQEEREWNSHLGEWTVERQWWEDDQVAVLSPCLSAPSSLYGHWVEWLHDAGVGIVFTTLLLCWLLPGQRPWRETRSPQGGKEDFLLVRFPLDLLLICVNQQCFFSLALEVHSSFSSISNFQLIQHSQNQCHHKTQSKAPACYIPSSQV